MASLIPVNDELEFPAAAVCSDLPYYLAVGNEVDLFEVAWTKRLAVMLKGPTGCGKTRLVEHMAARLGIPLFTVSCHEDTTTADLVGRHLLNGGDTEWQD